MDNYITPTAADAQELLAAGADVIATQATEGTRLADSFADIVEAVHAEGGLVMADVATVADAQQAVADGADLVGTTMVGFTPATADATRPAIELVRELVAVLEVPVILDGSVWGPSDVAAGFAAGAHAVVAGSAVTAPERIMARKVAAAPDAPELSDSLEGAE